MRHGIKLSKKKSPKSDEKFKRMSDIPYALAVGSIQYIVQCTRPDAHWSAVKIILKYLTRTKEIFLIYGGAELILEGYNNATFQISELILEGYNNATFQSDDDDAKSQSGFIFKLNSGVVTWKSSMQTTTADSTTKPKYLVASEVAKEAVWMRNYIQELGVVPNIAEPVVILYSNNGAISQMKIQIPSLFQTHS
ncbi:UNVERIFIED_CONTAM: Retrovirus-related Pol polyprotein from transposon TNT 1-94 [Sesamum indicum]